ncbi:MAG: ATP-binding protein [Dermatophilus congolensis]|nr:ATP-binding protein [Dermatophilus congolensis]
MRWLRTYGPGSVGRRLAAMSFSLAGLMFIITVVSLVGLVGQSHRVERQTLVVAPALGANQTVRQTMVEAQSSLRGYMLIERTSAAGFAAPILLIDSEVEQFVRPFGVARARIGADLTRLELLVRDARFTQEPQVRSQLEALLTQQRTQTEEWWAFADGARSNPLIPAKELERGRDIFYAFSATSDEITKVITVERDQLRVDLREGVRWTVWAVVAATAGAVMLALIVGWRTTGSLTGPLIALRNTVRRQHAGDRTAWADVQAGATEVRDLAQHVNALTAAQHELIDGQVHIVDLQRAEIEVLRRIRDAVDFRAAMIVAVGGAARALGADRVVAGELDENGGMTDTVLWEDGKPADEELPEPLRRAMGQMAIALWDGDRRLAVEDTKLARASGELDHLPQELLDVQLDGGFLLMPFGVGSHPKGSLVVRSVHGPRAWTEAEVSFVHHIVAELANRVVAFEREADRTEHVRRLEDLDKQKDAFMSTVSHELRTPLTSITGYIEMLDDGDAGELTETQRKMLDVVDRNAQRLRGLIEDLLVLNRLEASVQKDEGEVICAGDLIRDVCEEMIPVAARGDVTVVVADGACGAGTWLRGDRAQLGRALTNIVSNGIKFTPAGGTVTLASRSVDDGKAVEISCTDTGMGIPKADQARLFTRFFRASNATSAQVPGTGLGLVIVQGIVERHRGALELDSTEGVGTTFTMTFPTAPVPATLRV